MILFSYKSLKRFKNDLFFFEISSINKMFREKHRNT